MQEFTYVNTGPLPHHKQLFFLAGIWALLLLLRAQMETLPFILHFDLWFIGIVLISAAYVDHHTWRLPDKFTLLAAVLALAFSSIIDGWEYALGGALMGFGSLKAFQLFYRIFKRKEALGSGDAKLMLSIGAITGPILCCIAMAVACIAAMIHHNHMPGLKRQQTQYKMIPFGPYLVGAGLLAILIQPALRGIFHVGR